MRIVLSGEECFRRTGGDPNDVGLIIDGNWWNGMGYFPRYTVSLATVNRHERWSLATRPVVELGTRTRDGTVDLYRFACG